MKKMLPVGIESFEEIRKKEFYYVDKTGFISELLYCGSKVILFTRPRRFGKTLNMSMLKCFFEVSCNKTLFDGLEIARDQELCERYMGKYPVIFISFKDVTGADYSFAYQQLLRMIGKEALRFRLLLESPNLDSYDKELYKALIKIKDGSFVMSPDVLTNSLLTLSYLLEKHYGRKVIVLIDEYDVPLDRAFHQGYYDEMVMTIRNLFSSVLKTNDSLELAVLTGCLRISKESIFTGLNNLKVYSIIDIKHSEYFGFTDSEVDEILSYYGLTDYKDVICDWYDGYLFGKVSVYCPWDVINYCNDLRSDPELEPENYWANTSSNDLIRHLLEHSDLSIRDDMEQLVNGGTIVKNIEQDLTYRDIYEPVGNVWSVLFSTGYLTQRERLSAVKFRLAIPNKEIQNLFIHMIEKWFDFMIQSDTARLRRFCESFINGDVDRMNEILNDYLLETISVRDTAVAKGMQENFYHGLVVGLLRSQGGWIVKSNPELGNGYGDIVLLIPGRVGIVIELKYVNHGDLRKGCLAALEQIEEKQYTKGLTGRVRKVMKYGIAFHLKECLVMKGEDEINSM